MMALGARLAVQLEGGQVVTLSGDLGAGKTTLVRGILRGLGFDGRVKSPSYGLVESYDVAGLEIHHLDLYRLGEPEELDFIGLEDLLGENSVLLVEWPERAGGRLPPASCEISIEMTGDMKSGTEGESVDDRRRVTVRSMA
ncbi:MAG: tRNA (adenosine(37)-N6)-threonylcarbamoyltransferase complex ATPase subunit type 1 TsaE [Xanthomonadales bacterium]|nr:tRNA (adenosine(37)-N6)-threonylcarbamoyltransferase complex ATPase subunit type 1 TsaE [Ahrensia sp.]MBL38263.1 tRNA (adenosine(37)-N6)-threonylcarbamoyltransferase complex ATPase subunit type 1 TsaE [Xanthomonadales bacterium]